MTDKALLIDDTYSPFPPTVVAKKCIDKTFKTVMEKRNFRDIPLINVRSRLCKDDATGFIKDD